jgi:C4-dicarboxylate-specific signal transduction histidine kinase
MKNLPINKNKTDKFISINVLWLHYMRRKIPGRTGRHFTVERDKNQCRFPGFARSSI